MSGFLRSWGVFVIVAVAAWQAFVHYHVIGPDNQVLRADGKGYYAYLPAVFIYHDPQMNFISYYESRYNHKEDYADFRSRENGYMVDKYFAGVAVLQLPFFLAANTISRILHLPADGYAPLYQQFFVLGGLFYLFLGLHFLFSLLLKLQVQPAPAFIVVGSILFGTNLYHYTVYEQCMSHLYSFSLFAVFVYGVHRVWHGHSAPWVFICLLTLGIIFIIRPVNIIIAGIIPFIAGSKEILSDGIRFIFKDRLRLVAAIALALLPLSVQAALWHWQTGHWLVYSYGNEGMEWLYPKIGFVLFSFRKGWFVWTPLAFLGIAGLILLFRQRFAFFSVCGFMAMVVYVLSCWWTPAYGMSFGARPFIEYLIVPAIGLGIIFRSARYSFIKITILILAFFCIYVNQVQAWQYRHRIILWDGMDKAAYWRVFLQQGDGYKQWLEERQFFKKPEMINKGVLKSFTNDFERPNQWQNDDHRTEKYALSGKRSNYTDSLMKMSAILSYPLDSEDIKNDSMVQASVWFYGPQPDQAALVIKFEKDLKEICKADVRIRKFADHNFSWNRAVLQMKMPAGLQPGTKVMALINNNKDNNTYCFDDFRVDLIGKHGP